MILTYHYWLQVPGSLWLIFILLKACDTDLPLLTTGSWKPLINIYFVLSLWYWPTIIDFTSSWKPLINIYFVLSLWYWPTITDFTGSWKPLINIYFVLSLWYWPTITNFTFQHSMSFTRLLYRNPVLYVHTTTRYISRIPCYDRHM